MPSTRVLIIEDDPDIRKLIEVGMSKKGFEIATAADGAEGLEAARKKVPDLIILDATMPKLDGWGVLKELRADTAFAFTPVLLVTALGSQDNRVDGFRLGADDYIQKPFRMEELDLRVTRALRHRAQQIYFAKGLSRATTQTQSAPSGAATTRGTLDVFSALTLLCMLNEQKRDGVLRLTSDSPRRESRVKLRGGLLVSVEVDGATVDHAAGLEQIATWRNGSFEFATEQVESADAPNPKTFDLLAAARKSEPEPPSAQKP